MRGNTSGTGVLVALQGLYAAQCKHEATRRDNEISPHTQGPCDIGRGDEFARGDDLDAVMQTVLVQLVNQQRQAFAQRQADVIDQGHGGRTGATVGTVNGNEIRCAFDAAFQYLPEQLVEPTIGANHGLETNRFSRHLANPPDHVEQFGI